MNASDYETVKQLDHLCHTLGFSVVRDKIGHHTSNNLVLCVNQTTDALPIYARKTELFTGNVEECISFLRGWEASATYHKILFNKKPKDVERAEQNYIKKLQLANEKLAHKRLMHILSTGKDIAL